MRLTAGTLEVFHRGERVASHARSDAPYGKTTVTQPHAAGASRALRCRGRRHAVVAERRADVCGDGSAPILSANPLREQALRSALGLQRVGKQYGAQRTEVACATALCFGANSLQAGRCRMLTFGRETHAVAGRRARRCGHRIAHGNLRGPSYYH